RRPPRAMSPCNYSLYPRNWATEIRPAILRRAGEDYELGTEAHCEFCHLVNRTLVRRSWKLDGTPTRVILTVAHLDHDPSNNDPENLRALCQMCHNVYDRPVRLINAAYTRRRTQQQRFFPFHPTHEEALRMAKDAQDHPFNVLLNTEQVTKLGQLAAREGISKAQVLRRALEVTWLMKVAGTPVCASGLGCFVPQMHAAPQVVTPPAAQFEQDRKVTQHDPPTPNDVAREHQPMPTAE
ncbi:hypothetical protein LCGC14_3167410, partial [marine sediment metagenome]